jgi:3-hydroxyacyl-[acyl-carrier-protein] dehydratase
VKFLLVDRVTELEPRSRIVGHKALSLAEEYLADHFPAFPVLPGVLMLEALIQNSAWLVRDALDFDPTIIVLKQAHNVTYKSFVSPGQVLTLTSICKQMNDDRSIFTASGNVDGREMLKGRIELRHLRLADRDDQLRTVDESIRDQMRARWRLLWKGAAVERSPGIAEDCVRASTPA